MEPMQVTHDALIRVTALPVRRGLSAQRRWQPARGGGVRDNRFVCYEVSCEATMDPTMEELSKAVWAKEPDYDGKRHCPTCGSEVIEPGRDVGESGQTQHADGGPPITKVRNFLSKCKKGHPVKWKVSA